METLLCNPSGSEFSRQEQSKFDYRGWLVNAITPRGQLFINSVKSYAYDAANVTDDNNFATVLKSFVITSSKQVEQVKTKNILALDC